MIEWYRQGRERERLHAFCHYQLEVQERVDEEDFDVTGPLPVSVIHTNSRATCLVVDTDQSGLIGLIRYLHQQGIVLLSLCRTPIEAKKENDNAC